MKVIEYIWYNELEFKFLTLIIFILGLALFSISTVVIAILSYIFIEAITYKLDQRI